MAIDRLHDRIRKTKCPLVVDFDLPREDIPQILLDNHTDYVSAYKQFCEDLLDGLKEILPAVRFRFGTFAAMGEDGIKLLKNLLNFAKKCGYYIFLDGISSLSAQNADSTAEAMFGNDSIWTFDGYILEAYIGSDGIRPYVERMNQSKKDLFVVIRTSNRSSSEIQDLLTGSRLVHMAAADVVTRYSDQFVGKCAYSRVSFLAAASSAESLRSLREKYKNAFLLLDGSDYPNANAKNCSFAFDRFGYGAAACVGASITAAWKEAENPDKYVQLAVDGVLRFKKNIGRYISVL